MRVRGLEVVQRFSTLVNPGRPIPPIVTELTGIDDVRAIPTLSRLLGSPSAAVRRGAAYALRSTGSAAAGGDKAGWINTLATLRATSMPKLAGVIWFDAKDPYGDFRLRGAKVTSAFKTLLKGACR